MVEWFKVFKAGFDHVFWHFWVRILICKGITVLYLFKRLFGSQCSRLYQWSWVAVLFTDESLMSETGGQQPLRGIHSTVAPGVSCLGLITCKDSCWGFYSSWLEFLNIYCSVSQPHSWRITRPACFGLSPLSVTLITGLSVSSNELMIWIRCVWLRRHGGCAEPVVLLEHGWETLN